MTTHTIISRVDAINPNSYDFNTKRCWLRDLEAKIKLDVMDMHQGVSTPEDGGLLGGGETLLAPDTFEEMYAVWLDAQIYCTNGEAEKYNYSIERFHILYQAFCNWYNRTHMPIGQRLTFF